MACRIEEIARQNWQPSRGDLALPALTLDEAAFAANRDLFLRWCKSAGVAVAPHAKTPMSPELARSLREAGAWGTTVANIQQAAVLLAMASGACCWPMRSAASRPAGGSARCSAPIPTSNFTPSRIYRRRRSAR